MNTSGQPSGEGSPTVSPLMIPLLFVGLMVVLVPLNVPGLLFVVPATTLFGTVGGVGLGLFLGWAMVDTLADEGFTAFAIPTGQMLVILVLGALVGVVAALRPARRAARLDVLQAIATD